VTDAIRNLSAMSEENASTTEQTTASMDKLNATMSVLAGKADELGALAQAMQESLEFFKL
jgi:methyl-accepting chemotaxis protein